MQRYFGERGEVEIPGTMRAWGEEMRRLETKEV